MRNLRRKMPVLLAALVLLLVAAGVVSRQPVASAQGSDPSWKPVTVLYLSDTRGKTEPCG